MKCYVITTGKGEVWVTYARSVGGAQTRFHTFRPGIEIASIVEAQEF